MNTDQKVVVKKTHLDMMHWALTMDEVPMQFLKYHVFPEASDQLKGFLGQILSYVGYLLFGERRVLMSHLSRNSALYSSAMMANFSVQQGVDPNDPEEGKRQITFYTHRQPVLSAESTAVRAANIKNNCRNIPVSEMVHDFDSRLSANKQKPLVDQNLLFSARPIIVALAETSFCSDLGNNADLLDEIEYTFYLDSDMVECVRVCFPDHFQE